MSAFEATPISVPSVSKRATKREARTTTRKSRDAARDRSSFRKIGDGSAGRNEATPAEKSGSTLNRPSFGLGTYRPVNSHTTPSSQVSRIPQRILPLMFLAIMMPVARMPIRDRTTVMPTLWNVPSSRDCLKENRAIFVAGFATMTWALNRPMRAMNKPMPTDTACFMLRGIVLKMACRMLVRDMTMKMTPSTKTAARAISQE